MLVTLQSRHSVSGGAYVVNVLAVIKASLIEKSDSHLPQLTLRWVSVEECCPSRQKSEWGTFQSRKGISAAHS